MKIPEILAPAGSIDAMKAAVAAGCDAVYMGGSRFGARAYANNPEEEDMLQVLDYLHLRGRKLYVTVNTLVKDHELGQLGEDVGRLYEAGLDAAIVQDVGALRYLHHLYPELPLHASTQMTLTQAKGANVLKQYGVNRIVPARELSIEELRAMRADTNLEIEVFVHGALCYSYSGQCLLSSMIGGRSGNRGRCAQPCRMKYSLRGKDGSKPDSCYMSLKDLCSLDLVGDLMDAGVDSFKIEGRMKKPEYVALCTQLYRKYRDYAAQMGAQAYRDWIQENPSEYQNDVKDLMDLYNRGGFTKGYLVNQKKSDMLSGNRPNHNGVLVGEMTALEGIRATIQLSEEIHGQDVLEFRNEKGEQVYEYTVKDDCPSGCLTKTNTKKGCGVRAGMQVFRTRNGGLIERVHAEYCEENTKIAIKGHVTAKVGQPLQATVTGGPNISLTYCGDSIEKAMNRELTEDELTGQLRKLGTTDYVWDELTAEVESGGFLSVGQLKKFRRELIAGIEEKILDHYHRTIPEDIDDSKSGERQPVSPVSANEPEWIALVSNTDQLSIVAQCETIDTIYLDCDTFGLSNLSDAITYVANAGKKAFLFLPAIFRMNTERHYEDWRKSLSKEVRQLLSGYVIRNLEELSWIRKEEATDEIRTNSNLYLMNREARGFYQEQNVTRYTACLEASKEEWESVGVTDCDVILYGYQPVMQTEGCAVREFGGCGNGTQTVYMTDEQKRKFAVVSHCESCYSSVYYPDAFSLHMHLDEILAMHPAALRLDFPKETAEETEQILNRWIACANGNEFTKEEGVFYTKGHYNRPLQ